MRIQPVGDSGLQVSSLTLGTMGWGEELDADTVAGLATAFRDAGGTTFDTAHAYGPAEAALGQVIRGWPRDQLTIVGKAGLSCTTGAWVTDTSRRALMHQLDASLRQLGTDYLDLWLVHRWSDDVPLAESMSALEAAQRSGRVRYVGVSNYTGWQLTAAAAQLDAARIPLVANEIQYSLLVRQPDREVIPAARYSGCGILAWAPLAGGVLSGKYRHGTPADSRAAGGKRQKWAEQHLGAAAGPVVAAVTTAADGLGASPAEVALSWVRDRPGVASCVVGARTSMQLQQLLASEELVIPDAVREALDEVSAPA